MYEKLLEIMVFNIKKPLLNLSWKSINILLAIDYKSHEIRRVMLIIEGKKHFSQIRTTKWIFISSRKFIVRMSRFWKMFA